MKELKFLFFFVFVFSRICFAEEWTKIKETILEDDLHSLCIHPLDEKIIYCGSDNAIYKSQDKGKTWQSIYTIKGENKVNFIFCDPYDFNTLYIALDKGLFRSKDGGKTFQQIFRESSEKVLYVTKDRINIYTATDKGLYVTNEDIWRWQKISGLPQDVAVKQILFSPKEVSFIVTDSGVYRSKDRLKTLERIFISQTKETIEDTEEYFAEEETYRDIPKVICIDKEDPSKIFLGTNKGLFVSSNAGETFKKLILPNLGEPEIRWIEKDIRVPHFVYLATDKGFFKVDLNQEIAFPLYQGLITQNTRFFQQDNSGRIWLVTDKGLYVNKSVSHESFFALNNPHLSEPTIREIQEAALRYNEVHPEKIKAWRNSLKFRALFPSISLNYDKTIYGSTTKEFVYVGPRDWELSFSWDVADLIWNSYQDDVDTRSRLNTQLRIDILEEINRIYFERERLKRLIEASPPKDEKEKIERELRLEELTSLLDGYTGGTFSQRK